MIAKRAFLLHAGAGSDQRLGSGVVSMKVGGQRIDYSARHDNGARAGNIIPPDATLILMWNSSIKQAAGIIKIYGHSVSVELRAIELTVRYSF